MRAVILAAGIGNRLAEVSNDAPKCLLEIGGISLLERHIKNLQTLGIRELTLVVGYQADRIKQAVEQLSQIKIQFIENSQYRLGSIISFYHAKDAIKGNEDVLLMDADVLYSDKILATLHASSSDNVFLLDKDFIPGDEPVKLCIRDEEIIEFRKQIDKNLAFDFQGESVGFFRFSAKVFQQLLQIAGKHIELKHTDMPYEDVIRELLLKEPALFHFEDITGLPWIEIDFPEDLERARNEILGKI